MQKTTAYPIWLPAGKSSRAFVTCTLLWLAQVMPSASSAPAQQAYVKASNTGPYDLFGFSVAVADATMVIGARGESSNATGVNGNENDNSAIDSGAAYVFVRNGTNWSQQTYLKASNTGADDNFGRSVAVAGNTVVIGAIGEASSGTGVDGDQGDNSLYYPG